jgi:hypothetical protein
VADDLTDEFLSAPVVGFWTSFDAEEGLTTLFKKESPELEVALTAESEFSCCTVNAFGAAFTLDEHSEFKGDFVVFGNGQGAQLALDTFLEKFEGNHGDLLEKVP